LLTTSFHIHFIRPVVSGTVSATGKLKYQSENLFVAEAALFNARGKEIAFGTGNFMKSKIELSEKIGYL
ncbi:MAG: PaaI family thioesterase, partial [Sinomicrobium sp.]|nr:PaaI family thioesterase [Sinomicrobium sp.]